MLKCKIVILVEVAEFPKICPYLENVIANSNMLRIILSRFLRVGSWSGITKFLTVMRELPHIFVLQIEEGF